ncbi:hypothetical protein NUW58_g5067 [Xylaria curta]|uniref:Uncharacterized protein n=1 Tax=Xylaria curta TaxID=42375 RepID=A0ACC1P3K9_9PEZI|nr:hypothetical protein NUW58_g5067 [Xylaria curta]
MSVAEAIRAIKAISSDLIAVPGSEEYGNLTNSYFTELEREIKPACFVTPNSTAQVAEVVKAIKPFARPSLLAICGAGQQATRGVANVQGGVTLHLHKLRGLRIDTDKGIVSVAAGEHMGSVYDEVTAAGLGVVGNRHSSGGIGGDAVQGEYNHLIHHRSRGLSYFSYANGFVCDNVANYEIVLASGDVVNANAEANRDLWVALKGGANNFGIVTRFDLRVFPQGQLWGGKVFYFQPSFSGQIGGLVEYLKGPNPDVDVHICLSLGPEKPKALEPFSDIQPQIDQMKTLRVASLKALTDEAYSGAATNRVIKMTTTVKADTEILEFAVDTFRAALDKLKRVGNLLFSITFEPIPVSLIEQSIARGGNSLGLSPSDGPLVVVLLYTSWDKSSDDERIYEVNKEALQIIEAKALETNVYSPYLYMNYAFSHQDPIASYGSESKATLQAVSAKYDPDGFFQTAGVGPWKILE